MRRSAPRRQTPARSAGSADRGAPSADDTLARPFALLAFDWDGTAVPDRNADAEPVRHALERLLRRGVVIAVITGTRFENIDRQLSAAIDGPHKRNLYILTNRGSEVFGFDDEGRPARIWYREATPDEEEQLTRAADATRDELMRRTGLEFSVIYDRLNRRKIDLIPLTEWADPPKSRIGALLDAVQARLRDAGLDGGIREAIELAHREARAAGLTDPRVTSDVKHVEIGLTDKSDSVRWLMEWLALTRGIGLAEILIGGDEFGPIGGIEGSDSKMLIPEAELATFVSVGPEPNGVPKRVLHLGGGPDRFLRLLEQQAALHERPTSGGDTTVIAEQPPSIGLPLSPTDDPTWVVAEEGFNLAREHEIESLFSVANGYVGTRGSLAEGSSLSAPATFVAGVFARADGTDGVPELARAPDWMRLKGAVDGHEIRLETARYLEHFRLLDLRQGILWRIWRHEDATGRINRVVGLRIASLADRHLMLQTAVLSPENYSGRLDLEAYLETEPSVDTEVTDTTTRLEPAAPVRPGPEDPTQHALTLRARGTETIVAFAASARPRPGAKSASKREVTADGGDTIERWEVEVDLGRAYRFDRLVSVYTSRDAERPERAAAEHLDRCEQRGPDQAIADHVAAWIRRWHGAAIEVEGDPRATQTLRFAGYHLISAANPEDDRVSVGARGLTGGAYKGHVFWDVEIFMLPFFTLTHPPTARALLMYRYHTLAAARENASHLGFRGALFAWESADTGHETAPAVALAPDGTLIQIRSGEQEDHINAAVAYAVWQYWRLSGDDEFLRDAGAEILLETARFWASRGRLEEDGLVHIRHVIGPDEYHEDVDDSAYTNCMARWNLQRGVDAARILRRRWPARWRELAGRLELRPDEPREWARLAAAMYTGYDPGSGIIEQFHGFHDLDPIDLTAYEPREAPMDMILGRERTQRSQVIKQADVVLLLYLLWDEFPPEVREANYRYYEPRCGHGSSLSPGIHALVAARLGFMDQARRYFRQAAEIDLANNMGNAAGGVHTGALGSLWQAAALGFSGLRVGENRPAFAPQLPDAWSTVRFRIAWRGRTVAVRLEAQPASIELELEDGPPLEAAVVDGPETLLQPRRPTRITQRDGTWNAWQEAPP